MLESFVLTQKELYSTNNGDLSQTLKSFNKTEFFTEQADIFYFRIVDRVATYRLQTKSLYLDSDGNISMWKATGNSISEPYKSVKSGNRTSFINTPENEKHFVIYPMSKDAVKFMEQVNLTDRSNQTDLRKFSSQILAEEMEGYNLVASMIPDDILTTVEAINASFYEPIQV